jgi:hypothetical protein
MRFFTAALALALSVGLSGTAVAMVDLSESSSGSAASVQQVSAPDQLTTSAANPRQVGPDQLTAPAANAQPEPVAAQAPPVPVAAQAPPVPVVPSGGGLSAFLIVLISVGGALVLCAFAYTAIRVHRHSHAVT